MQNLILRTEIGGLSLLANCDKPVELPKSSTNRYSFQVMESGGLPLVSMFLAEKQVMFL